MISNEKEAIQRPAFTVAQIILTDCCGFGSQFRLRRRSPSQARGQNDFIEVVPDLTVCCAQAQQPMIFRQGRYGEAIDLLGAELKQLERREAGDRSMAPILNSLALASKWPFRGCGSPLLRAIAIWEHDAEAPVQLAIGMSNLGRLARARVFTRKAWTCGKGSHSSEIPAEAWTASRSVRQSGRRVRVRPLSDAERCC